MEEMIVQFFLAHGWKLTLLALSGIFFLGVLKYFDLFKKLEGTKKKAVYAAISAGFAIGVCGAYLWFTETFTWGGFGIISVGVFGVNQTAYAVYEDFGIRTLVKKLATLFINFVAKKQLGVVRTSVVGQDVVNDLEGLDEEILDDVSTQTEAVGKKASRQRR